MSTTLDELLSHLWASRTLKRDALEAAHSLEPALRKQLEDLAKLMAANVALRTQLAGRGPVSEPQIETPMSSEKLADLLELLTLAAFHSDTLFYLSSPAREQRLEDWAESTGFQRDLVREAAVLGPSGIKDLLKRAA